MQFIGVAGRESWIYEPAGFGRLIFGNARGKVDRFEVWDRQGRTLRSFALPPPKRIRWTRLSPDGRTMAVWEIVEKNKMDVASPVLLYETATGRPRGKAPYKRNSYMWGMNLAISPDGRLLTTSEDDTTVLLWDIAKPLGGKPALAAPKTADDAEKAWELLGDPDPVEADRALWALVAAPDHAVRLASDYLLPMVRPEAKRLQTLIAQLGAGTFKEREAAGKELVVIGEAALPALRAATKDPKSDDQRRRLETLIAQLETRSGARLDLISHLREIRALEVLERAGTKEARSLLQTVAASEVAVLKREAQLILAR
jgi:hypothetical protein